MAPATCTAGALVLYSLVTNRSAAREATYIARNAAAAVALVTTARRRGLTSEELGLDAAQARSGARVGAASAVVVAAAVVAVAALVDRHPAGRVLLSDRRATLRGPEIVWQCMVRIPVGTAAFEELAFRGVLQGLVAARRRDRAAIAMSSAVFGLWHVGPTLAALRINGVQTGRLRSCAAAVVASAGAGVALGALRSKAGHLAAPWLAHCASNVTALVVAAVWQRRRA
ncbi:MAG TPA: CPBP family intramembrane glutamic endopeptidase [Euzebyales bacterium]